MTTIFSGLATLVSVLIAIPPLIWIISVSFLGRAFQKAKEEVAKNEEEKRKELNKQYKEAELKLNEASKSREDPEKEKEAGESFKTIKQKRRKFEKQKKRTIQRYNMLSLIQSIGVPFLLFLAALIITWLHPYYISDLRILSSALVITIGLIIAGVWQIYKVMKTIEEVAQPAEEIFIKLTTEAFKQVMYLERVYISVDNETIKDNTGKVIMTCNKKQELKIGIRNTEGRMAKNIEIGFIFPGNFVVEKKNYHSIYADGEKQIVRYETSSIQGDTNLILSPLIITPLKKGSYKIKIFIKAENIEATDRILTFEVTGRSLLEEALLQQPISPIYDPNKKGD